MRHELKIPWYLIWRFVTRSNKWALSLTIFLMAVAFINIIFVSSLLNGIVEGTNDQVINTYSGHVALNPPEGRHTLDHVNQLLEAVEKTSGVVAASDETLVPASLAYKNFRGTWEILAIDPAREQRVTNVAKHMIAGSYLEPNDTDGIIIGRQLAGGPDVEMNALSFKNAQVGEKVILTAEFGQKEFTIRGIYNTKFVVTDTRSFITQSALQSMLPSSYNSATKIIIRLNKKGQEDKAISALKAQNINATYLTWEDASGIMKSITKSFLSINMMLTAVGVLIAAITIFIIIYIDITNKRRQIGILRAIGIKSYLIRLLYVLQSAVYSFAGVLVGTGLFFAAVVPYFKAHPFSLPICDAVLQVDISDYIIRAETIMLVALVSGLIPAILVTRVEILDSIRGK